MAALKFCPKQIIIQYYKGKFIGYAKTSNISWLSQVFKISL